MHVRVSACTTPWGLDRDYGGYTRSVGGCSVSQHVTYARPACVSVRYIYRYPHTAHYRQCVGHAQSCIDVRLSRNASPSRRCWARYRVRRVIARAA